MKLDIRNIEYVEVQGKYSHIVCGAASFIVEVSLEQLLLKLPEEQFIRVHRNYVVNVSVIHRIHLSEHSVSLTNKKDIPISRRYKEDLVKQFMVLK